MTTRGNRFVWFLGNLAVLALAITLWAGFSWSHILPPAFFPGPSRTWSALINGIMHGSMVIETGETVWRMLVGWLLASFVGIALGCVIGISPLARAYVAPALEIIRPLPSSAIAPVLILFFGISNSTILFLIAFGSLWPMLLTTLQGFGNIHPRLREVALALNMSRWDFLRKIALPNAMPDILSGLRLGLTLALILAIVGEMITVQGGIGSRILMASRSFRAPDIFAGVSLLGFVGFTSNFVLTLVERRLLRWRSF
jgi:ABC-type nitrate/sulfonate/bicarbonate transport system permease component